MAYQKTENKAQVLGTGTEQLLRRLLQQQTPALVRLLYGAWGSMQNRVTYQQIEQAVAAGEIDAAFLEEWSDAYSSLFSTSLLPALRQVALQGANAFGAAALNALGVSANLRQTTERVRLALQRRGALLVRNLSSNQQQALAGALEELIAGDLQTPAEVARTIRPLIGLTEGEARSVARRYAQMRADGVSVERARLLSARHAGRLHRVRASRIVRTELAYALNAGQAETVWQLDAQGDIDAGASVAEWLTAEDERVCPICAPLNGQTVQVGGNFQGGAATVKHPPIHPNCRCTLMYDLAPT